MWVNQFFPGGSEEIRRIFLQATEMPLHEYQALCFATLVRYYDFNFEKYASDMTHFVLTEDWYRTIPVLPDQVAAFLGDISASADEFQASIGTRDLGASDFTCFKDKPLFRHDQRFFVIDSAFLAEKEESVAFWRIHNALPKDKRRQFHRDWGIASERYVNWLLKQSVDGKLNKVYTNPRFLDTGDEVCDAIVICGESALFIESKGATLSSEAKYGNSSSLKDQIEEKFVATEHQKKGVSQLAARIEEVFRRKSPRGIKAIDLSKVIKVFPVLITRDDIGAVWLMNTYLNSRFRDLFHRKAVSATVTPLFSLSAQDVEMICGYLADVSFAELLEERHNNDHDLLSTFWTVDNSIISVIGPRKCKAFSDAYDEQMQSIAATLSPSDES